MNATIKTILLTVTTLSLFTIAMIEISGISTEAFLNKLPNANKKSEAELLDISKKDSLVKKMPQTEFLFAETQHDFGTIKEGDKVRWSYHFTNTGKNSLVISNVVVSCGCTAPFFPKEPIAPGAQGEITLEFNSDGKKDKVQKNALVNANTPNSPFSIGFTANVIK